MLLVVLGVRGSQGASRDELAELLWPAGAFAHAARSLDPMLSRLRRLVGPVSGRGQVRLVTDGLRIDVIEALGALNAARAASTPQSRADLAAKVAATLARDLVPGCRHAWVDDAREGLREAHADALELLAAAHLDLAAAEAVAAGISVARKLVALRPLAERPTVLLMDLFER